MELRKKNNDAIQEAIKILQTKKIALFIIAYNAEEHIEKTISRIPEAIRNLFSTIFVIDDSSTDSTLEISMRFANSLSMKNFIAMRTPFNQGYGGNQKIGYSYSIKQDHDYVIMLHADGQYPPEYLPEIIREFNNPDVSAVFGSRMINKYQALKGGMPLYKWTGNQILTKIENKILGSNLSEFHSGYRAYSIKALKSIPFLKNSDDFHFDTDIIIQLTAKKLKITEVPMPTHYGDEECHVNGFKYAYDCFKSVIKYRLHKIGIFYQPNFDIEYSNTRNYDLKNNPNTLHYYIKNLPWKSDNEVADIGANDGRLAASIAHRVKEITAVDIIKPMEVKNMVSIELDLNNNFDEIIGKNKYDKVLALDIIEHLNNPEEGIAKINNIIKNGGYLFASTANIAYIIMRCTLLIGWFNYGNRGILDMTHHRLFTVNSFKRLLKNSGFEIKKIIGFGPPIADQIGKTGIIGILDSFASFLARIYPSLFSFNFLIIARKKKNFDDVYKLTINKN